MTPGLEGIDSMQCKVFRNETLAEFTVWDWCSRNNVNMASGTWRCTMSLHWVWQGVGACKNHGESPAVYVRG